MLSGKTGFSCWRFRPGRQIVNHYVFAASRVEKTGRVPLPADQTGRPVGYGFRICRQASASRSAFHAALAGLVEGRQTAGRPVCGSIYCR